jgi:hypothetical protein
VTKTVARGVDVLAVVAAAVALIMLVVYVQIMREQDDSPQVWVLAVLGGSALLAGYGALRTSRLRTAALATSGMALVLLGLLAILSIGFPILLAGVAALVAAARSATLRTT